MDGTAPNSSASHKGFGSHGDTMSQYQVVETTEAPAGDRDNTGSRQEVPSDEEMNEIVNSDPYGGLHLAGDKTDFVTSEDSYDTLETTAADSNDAIGTHLDHRRWCRVFRTHHPPYCRPEPSSHQSQRYGSGSLPT